MKTIFGMTVRGSYKRIFGLGTDSRCHAVSRDGITWSCILPEKWKRESSSRDFVPAISVPERLKSDLPESNYIATKTDGTVSYGGKV